MRKDMKKKTKMESSEIQEYERTKGMCGHGEKKGENFRKNMMQLHQCQLMQLS